MSQEKLFPSVAGLTAEPTATTSLPIPEDEQLRLDTPDEDMDFFEDVDLSPGDDYEYEDGSRSFSPIADDEAAQIDAARYPERRRLIGKPKRGRHHRSKKAFKHAMSLNRSPEFIPDFGPGTVALSPYVLRSATFGAGNAAWQACRTIAEAGGKWIALPSGDGDEVLYSGVPMTQDTAAVLFAVLHISRGKKFDTSLFLRPNVFIQDTLLWPDTPHSHQRLLHALDILATARLMRDWSEVRYESLAVVRFLSFERQSEDEIVYKVHSSLAHAFRGYQTYVPLRKLSQLTRNLDRWLFLMICASDCRHPFALARLRQLYGTSQAQSEFGRDLRAALKTLAEYSLITSFNPRRGFVTIEKTTKPSQKTPLVTPDDTEKIGASQSDEQR